MKTEQIKGKLLQLRGEIKRRWGRLTDDDLMETDGNLDKLAGRIQERSGETRDSIEKWFKAQGF